MKKLLLILFCFGLSLFAKEVTVSIIPQKYFVEKIAGEKLSVNVMVKKGFSPATYEPRTSQMRKLSKSIAYFSIGVPFEKMWLKKFSNTNKKLLIVDTTEGIEKIAMEKHEHHEEEAHHEKHHEHEALDPHIWLDPVLVKIQANNIYKSLVKIDKDNASFYKNNYENFLKELDSLYLDIKKILKPVEHKAFMVFHPSWGYFAKRFHLEQIAVEVQGKEPKPSQLIELIKEAKEHNIKIVFVAPQFSQKSAKQIATHIKGKALIMNPLALNWDENLKNTAKQIASSYK